MANMIFVNLPVRDLKASMAYYKTLGFDHNPQFTDDTAACIVVSDTIFVMLLTHDKFREFSGTSIPDAKAQIGALYALSRDSRAAAIYEAWRQAAGGGRGRAGAPAASTQDPSRERPMRPRRW